MKRIAAFITVLIMLLSLTACTTPEEGGSADLADESGRSNAADETSEYLETTFSSGSGNIGNTTVRLKKGFDFVDSDSSQYNSELALTAVTLSAQVYPAAAGDHTEDILDKLGYDKTDTFPGGDQYFPEVCFGYKSLGNGKNLFTAVVRGTVTDGDKFTDVFDGAFSMFENSGKNIVSSLTAFMKNSTGKTEEELKSEDNYFFFTGHSLGGAVANYLSINSSVMEYAHKLKGQIYTCTFESPHTCINLLWMDPEGMSNAFNFKVEGDAVTNLPSYPGSTTYGKDIIFKVDGLDDKLFNEYFPNSKGKTMNDAVSRDGHGDDFGLHDICLDLLYILNDAKEGEKTPQAEVLDSNDQYAINIFLSNFSEQGAFYTNGFDISNLNPEEIIDFAFLFCKINRWSEITSGSEYYRISLDSVNNVLSRFFGFILSEEQAAAIPPSQMRAYRFFSSGIFYFLAADGESYNKFTVVKQMDPLPDGTYKVSFDVYALDLNEYWNNGINDGYYSLADEEAQSMENLTWCYSGTATVIPYDNNGKASYQLISYRVDNGIDSAERITVKQSVFDLLVCRYGEVKSLYPNIEPQFVNNGRYYVEIPGAGLYLWFQNYDWVAAENDYCQGVVGSLSNLTDNMPSQIALSEFNDVFGTAVVSPNDPENYYKIVDSPRTAYVIANDHYAELYFSVYAYGYGCMLEINLDSIPDVSGEVMLEDSFTGRISIIAG